MQKWITATGHLSVLDSWTEAWIKTKDLSKVLLLVVKGNVIAKNCQMRKFDTKWFLKVKSEAACKELQNDFTILNAVGNKVMMKFDKAESNAQEKSKSNYTYTGRDYKLTIAWEEKK